MAKWKFVWCFFLVLRKSLNMLKWINVFSFKRKLKRGNLLIRMVF